MTKPFIYEFQSLLTDLFFDKFSYQDANQKAKIWYKAVKEDLDSKKYTEEAVISALKRLLRKEVYRPSLNHLLSEIDGAKRLYL